MDPQTDAHPAEGSVADAVCPICRTGRVWWFATASDRLFGLATGSVRLYRCLSCACIFQHPMPDPAAISSFYPPKYWWTADRKSKLTLALSRVESAYREFVARDHVRFLQRCSPLQNNSRALLDIGCGSGTFLHLARRRGFQPHGMDASERAVAAAREQYDLPVRQGGIGSDAWEGHRFDVITMFHVLEHLPDPRNALIYAAGLLKPEGRLILQVPNASSFQARLFGPGWYGLDVPRHLINYTPKSLSLLLQQTGFSSEVVYCFSLRDNPASLASSVAIRLDPIGRRGRGKRVHPIIDGALELCYFGLCLAALPVALLESICGRGGTIWACARYVRPSGSGS